MSLAIIPVAWGRSPFQYNVWKGLSSLACSDGVGLGAGLGDGDGAGGGVLIGGGDGGRLEEECWASSAL